MKGKIQLIIAMMIFGSIGLFVREIDFASGQIALCRGIIGSLFLLSVSWLGKRKLSWKAIKSNLWLLLLSGAAIGFNWILLFEAYQYTSISNATLSYYFAPVFVTLLSPIILKEKLTPLKCCCLFGAVLGMFLISGFEGGAGNHLKGISYGLAAAALYASVILINKFLKGLSGMETTLVQLSMASLVLLPYVLSTEGIPVDNAGGKTYWLVILVGIVHTGFAYLLYFTAIKKQSGQTIAVFSYIDPIAAILLARLLLGEEMTFEQILGAVLILGATAINEMVHFIKSEKQFEQTDIGGAG